MGRQECRGMRAAGVLGQSRYNLPMVPRRHEVSRLEAFSDAAFAFALTLLVVSLDVPRSYGELMLLMKGFFSFACCFALLVWIWHEHNMFFRSYGLQDALTVALNGALLFVVLFYVYPLRFLTQALVGPMVGLQAYDWRDVDGAALMVLYSSGVLVLFVVFILLHWHAWRQRRALELDPVEELQLRYSTRSHAISAGIAVVSLLLLAVWPDESMWAGLIYCLMGPAHGWNGYAAGRAQERLQKQRSAPPEDAKGRQEAHHQPNRQDPDLQPDVE